VRAVRVLCVRCACVVQNGCIACAQRAHTTCNARRTHSSGCVPVRAVRAQCMRCACVVRAWLHCVCAAVAQPQQCPVTRTARDVRPCGLCVCCACAVRAWMHCVCAAGAQPQQCPVTRTARDVRPYGLCVCSARGRELWAPNGCSARGRGGTKMHRCTQVVNLRGRGSLQAGRLHAVTTVWRPPPLTARAAEFCFFFAGPRCGPAAATRRGGMSFLSISVNAPRAEGARRGLRGGQRYVLRRSVLGSTCRQALTPRYQR
jgi:hypothetical protein